MHGRRPHHLLLKMKRRSYQIALGGISAGLALLFVWLGHVVDFLTASFLALAALALAIPLCKNYLITSILAYIAASALAFLAVGNIFRVIPFIILVGPLAIFSAWAQNKKLKLYFTVPIKAVYINGALAALYFGFKTVFVDLSRLGIRSIHYALIALAGTVILIAADFLYLYIFGIMKRSLEKIIKE
jgi:hypothetical protein